MWPSSSGSQQASSASHLRTFAYTVRDAPSGGARRARARADFATSPSSCAGADPYFCNGAVVRHLNALGFLNVHNVNEDFYATLAAGRGAARGLLIPDLEQIDLAAGPQAAHPLRVELGAGAHDQRLLARDDARPQARHNARRRGVAPHARADHGRGRCHGGRSG